MSLSSEDIKRKDKPIYFKPELSNLCIPFSKIIKNNKSQYIYDGTENIPFENRHPIFKALMKIEFENQILRNIN